MTKTEQTFSMWYGEFAGAFLSGKFPNQRGGQALFNDLARHRPDLTSRLVGTPLDPFYYEDVPVATLDFLLNEW